MPRKLKPYRVSDFYYLDHSQGTVYLDRDKKDFFVKIDGEFIRAPSEGVCVKKAKEQWMERSVIEWTKIIVVETSNHLAGKDVLFLSYRVRIIGQSSAGRWMERRENMFFNSWHEKRSGIQERKYDQEYYSGSTENDAKSGVYVIPWSQMVEDSLKEIQAAIENTKARLELLLGAEDVVERLIATTGLALTSGKEGDDA